jgi:hypothetical protein
MLACDTCGTSVASPGQSDQRYLDSPRRHRHLMLPSNNEDKAQDQVPLAERIRHAPQTLHHCSQLRSIPAAGAWTPITEVATDAASEAPPTSSPPWDTSLWSISLDELLLTPELPFDG